MARVLYVTLLSKDMYALRTKKKIAQNTHAQTQEIA